MHVQVDSNPNPMKEGKAQEAMGDAGDELGREDRKDNGLGRQEAGLVAKVCLDSAASVHVLGQEHCREATNVQDLEVPHQLLTAGPEPATINQVGDVEVVPGLKVEGGWMAPWLDTTLISLGTCLEEGGTFLAKKAGAMLLSPLGDKHIFRWEGGLLVPTKEVEEECAEVEYYIPKAYKAKVKGRQQVGQGVLGQTMLLMVVLSIMGVALGGVGASQAVSTVAGGASPLLTQLIGAVGPILTLIHSSHKVEGEQAIRAAPKAKQVQAKDSAQVHACKCHLPHDPKCKVCIMARMRAAPASKREDRYDIGSGEQGYCIGIDYAGPLNPDVDGNTYFLQGVETAHTNYGMIQLTKDRTSANAAHAVKEMIRDIKHAGPNPKEVVRIHSDQDTSFAGELEKELLDKQVRQTNTGGHRPTNNSRTEKRIGLVLYALRAMLYTATGGTDYYEQLWGPAVVLANAAVNRATWSDGSSPYTTRVGQEYEYSDRDHVFGAGCVYWLKKEHRPTKLTMPGQEGIWIGRSTTTPDADLVVPIKWEGSSNSYKLGRTVTVAKAVVDNTYYPLRAGPDADTAACTDFESFMQVFHHQMYGNADAFPEEQVDGEDPILEVEEIKAVRGRGRKAKYLVSWKGSSVDTWEPLKHLTGCEEEMSAFRQAQKQVSQQGKQTQPGKGKGGKKGQGKVACVDLPMAMEGQWQWRANGNGGPKQGKVACADTDTRAVEELMRKQGLKGETSSWLPGYQTELQAVRDRRLERLSAARVKQDQIERKAIGLRMILEGKKDGRRKGRLILQGFREPRYMDGGKIDAPVASLTSIRTLLFMAGMIGDIVSSIDVSTAFLQADEYGPEEPDRYVYYQPH